jgi:Cu-Zn family superoxide dismutase
MRTAVLVLAAGYAATVAASGNPAELNATLRNNAGGETGWARLQQAGADVRMRLEVKNLSPGMHGVHIHTVGRCDAPDFATAGAHWNPAARQHGKNNPSGAHMGDLPNLIIDAKGRGTLIATLRGTTIAALRDADGSALVVHAAADDYRTDPSGNSGARVACGVLGTS